MRKRASRITSAVLAFIMTLQMLPLEALGAQVRHIAASQPPKAYVQNDVTEPDADTDAPEEPEADTPDEDIETPSEEAETEIPETQESEAEELPEDPHTNENTAPESVGEEEDSERDSERYIDILLNTTQYSLLSEDDAAFLCQYNGVTDAVFVFMEMKGYSLGESVQYGTLANMFLCDIETAIAKYPESSDQWQKSMIQLNVYLADINPKIEGTSFDSELRGYILDGFTYEQIHNAYGVYRTYGILMNDLLYGASNISATDAFSQEEISRINAFAEELGVSANAMATYMQDASIAVDELENASEKIQRAGSGLKGETFGSVEGGDEGTLPTEINKFFGAPICEQNTSSEQIVLSNGALIYETPTVTLPGMNGLDLTIEHQYNLLDANCYAPSYEIEYSDTWYYVTWGQIAWWHVPGIGDEPDYKNTWEKTDKFYRRRDVMEFLSSCKTGIESTEPDINDVVHYTLYYAEYYSYCEEYAYTVLYPDRYLQNMYGLGTGWSFAFSSFDVHNDILHMSDGRAYHVKNINSHKINGVYPLEDYDLDDLKFEIKENGFSNGSASSKYTLSYKNGRKEFFDETGKLIGIQDRYSNTIKLVHSTQNGYPCIRITDSVGRVILISGSATNTGHKMTVQLPDHSTLTYDIETIDGVDFLTAYTDTLGNQTTYSYETLTCPLSIAGTRNSENNIYAGLSSVTTETGGKSVYQYGVDFALHLHLLRGREPADED